MGLGLATETAKLVLALHNQIVSLALRDIFCLGTSAYQLVNIFLLKKSDYAFNNAHMGILVVKKKVVRFAKNIV